MTTPLMVLAALFAAGLLLGLVAPWLIVCVCEAVLLFTAFVVAVLQHKPLLATFATLFAGLFVMQIAYICSGLLAEGWRLLRQMLRGQPVDKLN